MTTTIETNNRMSDGLGYDLSPSTRSRFSVRSMLVWLHRQLEKRRSHMALLEVSDERTKR
jgi:hypothetical protein